MFTSIHVNLTSFYICLPACLSACLSICLSACRSVWLSVCLSICLSVCLLSVRLSSVCLSVCLPVCLRICLSVCLPVCLSDYLSVSQPRDSYDMLADNLNRDRWMTGRPGTSHRCLADRRSPLTKTLHSSPLFSCEPCSSYQSHSYRKQNRQATS